MIHALCNPLNCKAFACGWCEYDFWLDEVFPHDPALCPLLNERKADS